MLKDHYGNELSGANQDAITAYHDALYAFNIYRGDPFAHLNAAIEASPEFAMAYLMKAHLQAAGTTPGAMEAARELVAKAETLAHNEQEREHVAALRLVTSGEWTTAGEALNKYSMAYPHDLLALQCGHLMDFFCANNRNLRDRIARALPAWSAEDAQFGIVLGMHAFGLEETGAYAAAEEVGRKAIDQDPLDCWAHHAVTHVMEMQGRSHEGIEWMSVRERHWSGDDNFLKVHNWWHNAIFHLDLCQTDEALNFYDAAVRKDFSTVGADQGDASSLLWRLELLGVDVGDRWIELAETWDRHADGKTYPYNDLHAAMAYLGAGRDAEVDRLLAIYRNNASDSSEAAVWAREIGLPLIEGFAAFWQGDYANAVERLHPARFIVNAFGGSHAQRDVIDWTLVEAAVRGGLSNIAESVTNERLALKPNSPMILVYLDRCSQSVKE